MTLVCTAEINNRNDDDAHGAQLIILLPLEVKITDMAVLSGSGSCRRSGPRVKIMGMRFVSFVSCLKASK